MTKTDLQRVLSVSGQPGLFTYVAQATAGIIVESFLTGKRSCLGMSSRMTSLSDISIYTEDGEVKLQQVLENMRDTLDGGEAPSHKSAPGELKTFFEKVLPDYDRDRFYVSHMKKVVEWYNLLRQYASLDFVSAEDTESESENAGDQTK